MTEALALRLEELRSSLVYGIALASGWLTAAEKIYALKTSGLWDQARQRDQTDLLMAAGAYAEAIPRYAAFSHWRKVGDAEFALGNLARARDCYQRGENLPGENYTAFRRGPDIDRLMTLAIIQEDWTEVLRLVRLGEPDPFGKSDVTFAGSSRAKGPLIKLTAHAAAAVDDPQIAREMRHFFDLEEHEVAVFLGHAGSGAYSKDVSKLGKPPLLRIEPRTIAQIMEDGCSDRATTVATYLERLDDGFRDAQRSMVDWLDSGSEERLQRVVFWLTRAGSFEVFKSCLFALQCETGMFLAPNSRHIDFYTAHPWLTRASMRELLAALVATDDPPSADVLFACVIQHSASIMVDIERGTFDPDRIDPLVAIRSHPIWAAGIIEKWGSSGRLEAKWSQVRRELAAQTRPDVRRLPAFVSLCDELSTELLTAWKRDMGQVRWKAEEAAFLSLKELLPGVALQRHAMPTWLAPQHLDILVPEIGVAIEYQGEQHYKPVEIFGGQEGFDATVRRDENKRLLCGLAGITLECIRFDEDASVRLREIAQRCRKAFEALRR